MAARSGAESVDRFFLRDLGILSAIGLTEEVARAEPAEFRRLARHLIEDNRTWQGVGLASGLANGRGDWTAVSSPVGQATNLSPRFDLIREAMRGGKPIVDHSGGALPRLNDAALLIYVPLIQDDRVDRVLVLAVAAEAFRPVLGAHVSSAVSAVLLLHWDEPPFACIGDKSACESVAGGLPLEWEKSASARTGVASTIRIGGIPMLAMRAPTSFPGWSVVAATPEEILSRKKWDIWGASLIGVGLILVVGASFVGTHAFSLTREDVAKRRIAELEAQVESDQRFANMTRSLPGLVFRRVRHPEGWSQLHCMADSENVFHLPSSINGNDASCGDMLERMMDEDTARRWKSALESTAESLLPLALDGKLTDPSGQVRRFRVSAAVHRRADGSVFWDGVLLDTTDLHEAEMARRLTADQLAFALEFADAGIWEWDLTTNRTTWSVSQWRLFGYDEPLEEPSFEAIERKLHPDDIEAFWSGIDSAVVAGGDYTAEYRIPQPDGTIRWIAARARTTLDAGGHPLRITGLNIDITKIKRFQEDLRAAKEEAERANIAKSRFLAAASHDLRQPVQSLVLFAHVLSQKIAGHPGESLVVSMQQALDVLKVLLDSILDLSRLDAGIIEVHPTDIAIATFVKRIANEFEPRFAAKGLSLKWFAPNLTVSSDFTLLSRIVSNLVENALKYTNRGGVLIGARRRGRRLQIEVWDTGVGIPEEKLEEIFGEFVQLDNPEQDNARGLGLGLAIVRRLSRLIDAPLTVRSRPGRGSVFTLAVPCLDAAVPVPAPAPAVKPALPMTRSVLIVDDDPIILEGLCALMEEWGWSVARASDVEAARLSTGTAPDLIVTDYRLPDGCTGLDVIATLRRQFGAGIPAILLTGDSGVDATAVTLGEPPRLVQKPISPRDFRRIVDAVLPPKAE